MLIDPDDLLVNMKKMSCGRLNGVHATLFVQVLDYKDRPKPNVGCEPVAPIVGRKCRR